MSVSSASDYKYIASNSQNSSVALLSPCASKVHLKWIYNLSVTVLLRRRTTEFHVCRLFVWLNTLEKEKMWSFSLFQMTSGCIHVCCFLFCGRYIYISLKSLQRRGRLLLSLCFKRMDVVESYTGLDDWHKTSHDLSVYVINYPLFTIYVLLFLTTKWRMWKARCLCSAHSLKNAVWCFPIHQKRMKTAA